MKPDAADVSEVRKAGRLSLSVIAANLHLVASSIQNLHLLRARELRALALELAARHDHADPCEDASCLCWKAGQEYAQNNHEPPCKR